MGRFPVFDALPFPVEDRKVNLFVRFIFFWFWLDVLLFLLLGLLESFLRNILTSMILIFVWLAWLYLPKTLRKLHWYNSYPGLRYLFAVFLMALFEETLVTLNGGGLGGKATSLAQDLTIAVPVFMGIGMGLYLAHRITPMTRGEFFIFGALFGFLIEIVLNGAWRGMILLGGSAMGLYGMIFSACSPVSGDSAPLGIKKAVVVVALGTAFMLIGALFGDTLWRLVGV